MTAHDHEQCHHCDRCFTCEIRAAVEEERSRVQHECGMRLDEERHRLMTALEAAHPPHAPVMVPCIACEALLR